MLLLSGCSEKKPEAAAESTQQSEYTENKQNIMPDDTVLEEAARAMSSGAACLALNAGGDFVLADQDAIAKSLTLINLENSLTEESFQKLKDAGEYTEIADMTYAEYLERSK